MSAAQVLEREQRGEARLIFPTRRNLERLAQHSSFEAIRADALAHPIEPVTPWVEERERREIHHHPGASWLSGDAGTARRPLARVSG